LQEDSGAVGGRRLDGTRRAGEEEEVEEVDQSWRMSE
jgi:hypothetical protein